LVFGVTLKQITVETHMKSHEMFTQHLY